MHENAQGTWSRVKERIGVSLWTSFLAATIEVGVTFSCIYPWASEHVPSWFLDPFGLYGLAFFFFWGSTFAATALTAYMLDSSRKPSNGSRAEPP